MLSSKPILVSVDLTSEVAGIIRDNDCGWVVESEDSEKLKQALRYVLKADEESIRFIGNNSYSFALENLAKVKNLEKIVAILLDARRKI